MDAIVAAKEARELAELAFTMFAVGVMQTVDFPKDITVSETRGLYIASLANAWGLGLDDIANGVKMHGALRNGGNN